MTDLDDGELQSGRGYLGESIRNLAIDRILSQTANEDVDVECLGLFSFLL